MVKIMPDLPKRTLGRTGLNVTALGYGALELRGMVGGVGRPLTSGQPERILNALLDAGINYIDVALDYGEAESHIGRCIASRRKEFFLASKCGCPLDVRKFSPSERTRFGVPLPRLHDYSRDNIINACEQSLRRLKTDYLDVIQFHFSPASITTTLSQIGQFWGRNRFAERKTPKLSAHAPNSHEEVLKAPFL